MQSVFIQKPKTEKNHSDGSGHASQKSRKPFGENGTKSGVPVYLQTKSTDSTILENESEQEAVESSTQIQSKHTIGAADDPYEREADLVADHVVSGKTAPPITPIPAFGLGKVARKEASIEEEQQEESPPQAKLIQRQTEDSEKEEEEELQPKLIQRQSEEEEEELQPKLIQRQSEEEEEELQPKLIQRQSEEEEEELQPKLIQRQSEEEEEEEEELQPKLIQRQSEDSETEEEEELQPQLIQRECKNCRNSEEKPLQTKKQQTNPTNDVRSQGTSDRRNGTSTNALSGALAQSRTGESLNASVKNAMELSTGLDFSAVRIHSDSTAQLANRAIRARAFAHGLDIWLGRGESQSDRRLMAHELTHVVQQNSGNGGIQKIRRKPSDQQRLEDVEKERDGVQDNLAESVDPAAAPSQSPIETEPQTVEASEGSPNAESGDSDQSEEVSADAQSRGENAGSDDPSVERLPIDQDPNEKSIEEEPPAEDIQIQRQAEGCPPVEPVPEVEVVSSPASPQQDPAFIKAKNRVKNRAKNQSQHGSGEEKSNSANAAAEVKTGEKKSHGQNQQVGEMDAQAQKPPAFDKLVFVNKVLEQVKKVAPDTLDDFMKFANRGKADEVKAAVTGQVKESQKESQDPLDKATKKTTDTGQSPRTAGLLKVEPAGKRPGSVRADRAMPPPRTDSEVDFQSETKRTENILKEACITREYMDEHPDPELKAGAEAQDQLKQSSQESPQSYREQEAATLVNARARASSQGKKGVGDLFGQRSADFDAVGKNQHKSKTDNELKRDAAAKSVDSVFTTAQTSVQTRLTKLSTDVGTTFDREAGKASAKFQDAVDTKAKSLEKSWYESATEWVSEALFDAPPVDAELAYESARLTFVLALTTVIETIAGLVETGLADARKIVEQGKLDVQTKLDSLGSDLDDFRQQKSEEMSDRFRGLEGEINKKQSAIISDLAGRYVNAVKSAKKSEKSIRDKYKNAVDRTREVYNSVKDAVFGWIEKLSAVVGGAAKRIIREPGKFLRNLGAGIVQGFTMFMGNIGENIKGAVVEWVTGNMSSAGISLPKTFDARGIIGFLLELVGLGVANIKNIARKVFGRKVVSLIEKGVAGAEKIKHIFDILATDGPTGLFRFLAGEFETMKEKVLGEAGKAIAESLVVAGIKKVLGVISGLVSGGVGSVITIVLTIIDVVMWLRQNAARIAEVASTIAGMAMAILNGQVAAVAGAINNVLKRLLPMVLGFVGALVGIGGVVAKIQGIFKAIKRPATKAITKLFKSMKKFVKKLIAKVKKKFGKGKGKGKGKKEKKLSSKKVVSLVMRAMKQKTRTKVPGDALAEKRSQANRLLSKYQPRLKQGRLKISILDKSATDVEKDAAVDFEVSASPKKKSEAKLPINVEDEGAVRKRFAHARSLKKFTKESGFTVTDWGSTFNKLQSSTHRKDMSFGVNQNIINRQDGKLHFKTKVPRPTIVLRGAAEIQSSGSSYTRFEKGQFGVPLIKGFLMGRRIKGVPSDSYKERSIVKEVADRAVSGGVLSKARGNTWVLSKNKHVSKLVIWKDGKFALIKKLIGKVREKFYGGFTKAVKGLVGKYTKFSGKSYSITGPAGKISKVKGKTFGKKDIPTIEHEKPVVQHWSQTGKNTGQEPRKSFYNDTNNLSILPRSINSSEGAKLKERYGEEVGKGFRGPGEGS
jgi:hypothetical protein